MKPLHLFALCGSLRQRSSNLAALQALQQITPDHIRISIDRDIGQLPLFNPDIEHLDHPPVARIKQQLAAADGLIIASPEYAHGITGVLKNALDWLVSGPEFVDKPIMLINASPRAHHAQDALREVVKTMSGKLIAEACVTVPLLSKEPTANNIITTPELSGALLTGIERFCHAITDESRCRILHE